MKSTQDEIYKKFTSIIYEWCEKHLQQSGVCLERPHKEMYGDEEFYAFKIGRGNFVEPHGYNPKKDAWLTEKQKSTIKWVSYSERLTLDALTELNELLKAAGAKTVYLHPYIWTDSKGVEKETVSGQQMILIQI